MSHFTTVKTELREKRSILDACRRMGLQVEENAQVRGWYGRTTQADIVVRMGDNYDVGLVMNAAGTYDAVCDWSMGSEAKQVLGADGQILTQEYAASQVVLEAADRGYSAQVEHLDDGRIEINLDNFQE